MSEQTLFRIRRISDGKWYGKAPRRGDRGSCWRPEAGKYMTTKGLLMVLRELDSSLAGQSTLGQVEVVGYAIREFGSENAAHWLENSKRVELSTFKEKG